MKVKPMCYGNYGRQFAITNSVFHVRVGMVSDRPLATVHNIYFMSFQLIDWRIIAIK